MHSFWPNTTDLAKEMPLVQGKFQTWVFQLALPKGHLLCMLFISMCLKWMMLQCKATGHSVNGMQSVELVITWFPF